MFTRGADRLLWWLSRGIGASSHYSGCAGDLCWTPWVYGHLLQSGMLTADAPGFVLVDATDVAPHCQKCLVKMDPPFQHVFRDMFDRLPSDLREMVDELAPKPGGDKDFFECQYEAVGAMFAGACEAPGSKLFRDGSTSFCLLHNRQCMLYGCGVSKVEACVIRIHWAGTTCLDITAFGSRAGIHGPHSKYFLMWCYERRVRRETLVFVENSPLWPMSAIEEQLGDIYEATYIYIYI